MCTGQRLLSTMNAWLLCLVVSVLFSGINGVMSQNGEYTLQHDHDDIATLHLHMTTLST